MLMAAQTRARPLLISSALMIGSYPPGSAALAANPVELMHARWEDHRVQLSEGQRVRVRQDRDFPPGPWPAEPTGRVTAFSDGAVCREVVTQQGVQRLCLVAFDEPQLDADGDSPYLSSEVLEKYLELTT